MIYSSNQRKIHGELVIFVVKAVYAEESGTDIINDPFLIKYRQVSRWFSKV